MGLHSWIVNCSILKIIFVGEPAQATRCFKTGSSRSPLADQKSCILGCNKLAKAMGIGLSKNTRRA